MLNLPKPDFVPDPFEWIYIPEGHIDFLFPYKIDKEIPAQISAFFIAKYPITIEQYLVYVNETKYEPWSNMWRKAEFHKPKHPMIDLYWHEAMVFCHWFSKKCGYPVQLPTAAQWQRAAQGDDKRKFPWGDEKDYSRCNVSGSKIGHTTPVTHYPNGMSPFGVMDMMGNIFEWCIEDYVTGEISHEFEIPAERNLDPIERLFKGCSFQNTLSSWATGATLANWSPYTTGIRLVTTHQID